MCLRAGQSGVCAAWWGGLRAWSDLPVSREEPDYGRRGGNELGSHGRNNGTGPRLRVGRRDGVAAGLLQSGEGARSGISSSSMCF